MKVILHPKSILLAGLCLLIGVISSCRKEVSSPDQGNIQAHDLAFWYEHYDTIKMDQAVIIYDASLDRDTNGMAIHPIDKYYEWKIAPDNGCAAISGNTRTGGDARHGSAQITFTCSGTYQIYANIYDSVTNEMVATTKKVDVVVTTEKLLPKQAIDRQDTLHIFPSVVASWTSPPLDPEKDKPDSVRVLLKLWTSKRYDFGYTQLEYTSTAATNSLSFTIADSARSVSYPFFSTKEYREAAYVDINLLGIKEGIPTQIAIKWLGKEYFGTMTYTYLQSCHSYGATLDWNNTGAMVFN